MTNRELLRAGLIASAVLLLGGGFAIYRLTEYRPQTSSSTWSESERLVREEGVHPRLTSPAEEGSSPSPANDAVKPAAVPMAVYSPARVARGPKEQVAALERRQALRSARTELIEGFNVLRKRVEKCGASDASFILTLEALDGAVRVESARVEEQGPAPSRAVSCVQSELAGQVIPAPSLTAGRRWEVTF